MTGVVGVSVGNPKATGPATLRPQAQQPECPKATGPASLRPQATGPASLTRLMGCWRLATPRPPPHIRKTHQARIRRAWLSVALGPNYLGLLYRLACMRNTRIYWASRLELGAKTEKTQEHRIVHCSKKETNRVTTPSPRRKNNGTQQLHVSAGLSWGCRGDVFVFSGDVVGMCLSSACLCGA